MIPTQSPRNARPVAFTFTNPFYTVSLILLALGGGNLVVQLLFFTFRASRHLAYYHDWIPVAMNLAGCVLLVAGLVLVRHSRRLRASGIAAAVISLILALGAPLFYGSDAEVVFTDSYRSPSGITIDVQLENHRLWLSRPRFIVFRQWLVSPTHSCNGTYRVDWQEEDVCVVHYLDLGRKEYHQHVLCFGNRKNDVENGDLRALLRGSWRSADGLFALCTTPDGLLLRADGEEFFYYFEQQASPPCHTVFVEPGAVVLFGHP